jgi:hypothetical protein
VSLFEPDILNDAASTRNARRVTPERRLLIAILADAIDCYQKNLGAHTARGKRLCREAEHWMLSDDQQWVFSFRNICDALGVDAEALRARTRAWKEPHATPGLTDHRISGGHAAYRVARRRVLPRPPENGILRLQS